MARVVSVTQSFNMAAENTAKKQRGSLRRCDRSNVFAAQVRRRKLQSQICQSRKFTLRYNGEFGTCEIGKLIDVEGFSLFPRERQ